METIRRLEGFEGLPFLAMTFPFYRSLLESSSLAGNAIACGAFDSARPTGLALAGLLPNRHAQIVSLYVAPAERKRGLGGRLLRQLEAELVVAGCPSAEILYNAGGASTPALERILAASQWPAATPRTLICRADGRILNAQWFAEARLPREAQIFSWTEITPEERRSIEDRQAAAPWVPDDLMPGNHEEGLEPLNSLGLRYKGEVVGWMITHRLAPKLCRYTCSFMRADIERRLAIVPMYREAITRQGEYEGFDSIGIWTVPYRHTRMADFVRNRMAPHLVSLETVMITSKQPASPAG
jgi:GNAT superfamily N-acetyltransferase